MAATELMRFVRGGAELRTQSSQINSYCYVIAGAAVPAVPELMLARKPKEVPIDSGASGRFLQSSSWLKQKLQADGRRYSMKPQRIERAISMPPPR
jgi:hypothetical protein